MSIETLTEMLMSITGITEAAVIITITIMGITGIIVEHLFLRLQQVWLLVQ
jgi:hypothetical protein